MRAELSAWALAVQLRARRGTAVEAAAVALLAAVLAVGALALPWLAARRGADEAAAARALHVLRRTPAADRQAAVPLAAQRLHDFYAVLGDVAHAEDALRTLFAAADAHGLSLDQADYRLAYDAEGRFYAYTVQLPVTGSYAAIRGFVERVLRELPYASLDEIELRRDDVGDADLKARLRFTLHLGGSRAIVPGAASAVGAVAGTMARGGR